MDLFDCSNWGVGALGAQATSAMRVVCRPLETPRRRISGAANKEEVQF